MPLRGQQPERQGLSGNHIPGGQYVIDRLFPAACDVGNTDLAIDSVIHRRAAVAIAGQVHIDQIIAMPAQLLVTEPAACGKVSQEETAILARRGNQLRENILTFRFAEIHRNGALALVESGPKQAAIVFVHRPAAIIQSAPDHVKTNDIGTQLGQCHRARGRCDKSSAFDNAQSGKNIVHKRFRLSVGRHLDRL